MGLSAAEERVLQQIERGEDRITEDLKELVRIPSVVGNEGACQEAMHEKLSDLGLAVETFEPVLEEVRGHPAYVTVPWSYQGRPNVIGRLPGSGGGRSLVLTHAVRARREGRRWTVLSGAQAGCTFCF